MSLHDHDKLGTLLQQVFAAAIAITVNCKIISNDARIRCNANDEKITCMGMAAEEIPSTV